MCRKSHSVCVTPNLPSRWARQKPDPNAITVVGLVLLLYYFKIIIYFNQLFIAPVAGVGFKPDALIGYNPRVSGSQTLEVCNEQRQTGSFGRCFVQLQLR
jgi:hypothetical protein